MGKLTVDDFEVEEIKEGYVLRVCVKHKNGRYAWGTIENIDPTEKKDFITMLRKKCQN